MMLLLPPPLPTPPGDAKEDDGTFVESICGLKSETPYEAVVNFESSDGTEGPADDVIFTTLSQC